MTRALPALALLLVALSAQAQYNGPAVEACRAYALKEHARDGMKAEDIVIVPDHQLLIERYSRKLGSQPVASILTGNGAVVLAGTPSAELSFICLLADEKRPVFFNWLPRQQVSALAQCSRSRQTREKQSACLDFLMRVAEQDLTQVYAERFQEANLGGEESLEAFRKANEEWKQYRDAECARRARSAPKGVSAGDFALACAIDLMRQRGRDLR